MPEIGLQDLEPGGSGVRAQAMSPDGQLVQDFRFVRRPRALHVLNAPSPAATASLAIGEEIAKEVTGEVRGRIEEEGRNSFRQQDPRSAE